MGFLTVTGNSWVDSPYKRIDAPSETFIWCCCPKEIRRDFLTPNLKGEFGGWPTPLKNDGVRQLEVLSQYMESHNPVMFQTTNQSYKPSGKLT